MSTFGTAPAAKAIARVASMGIDQNANAFLHDCFRQFGIQVVPAVGESTALFNRQKFEACLLRLYDPAAEAILSAARGSSSNRRMVIYGLARSTQEALKFSSYGINAVIDEPLERQSVLRIVRATHLLVIHELRRYVRVPVVSEVAISAQSRSFSGMSLEVSAGGMCVRGQSSLASIEQVNVVLALPGAKKFSIRAFICWSRENEMLYGLRFDSNDENRVLVRNWIDQYLEIM
ncbi:MAG TPA: PilZ domain-containing protein [Candidatus Angelobacter sp.]|nr:PilZ domain-containing protein [Candidatus Angelobacter sp.]